MDLRRVKPLDWLTGFFGAALVGLLWAPWYRSHGSASGWQAMAVDDVLLLIAGLLGIWVVVATAVNSTAAVPIAAATFATWGGLIACVLAVIRLIFPPDLGPGGTDRAAGVWLGTATAIGLAVSAAVTMHDERRAEPGSFKLAITELPAPREGR